MAKYSKEYYNEYYHTRVDKDRKNRQQLARKITNKQFVWDYLLEHPCVDCGESDPIVLEFDHVRGEKIINISNAVGHGWGREKILAEIEKCDVRCANCHRRKTHSRSNWFKG